MRGPLSIRTPEDYTFDWQGDSQLFTSHIDRSSDILGAYKELKRIMLKGQGSKLGSSNIEGPKNYLRTTIAAQQHGVNRINKELLRYSL